MKYKIIVFTIFCATTTHAQVQKIDLRKEFPAKVFVDLYGVSSEKKLKKLSSLSQMKDFEIHLKWSECVKLAPQVFQTQKPIRGWVALSWFRCLDQERKKKDNSLAVTKALSVLEKYPDLFREGPWADDLQALAVDLRLSHLEKQVLTKDLKVESNLDSLLSGSISLTAEQKGKAYQLLGDLALARKNYSEAQFLYEEAQNQKGSKYLQEKLDFLVKAQRKGSITKELIETRISDGEDAKIEERLRQSLKQNDAVSAIKDAMLILNKYPGSRFAKQLKDKPLEIYSSLTDKSAKTSVLTEMQGADGQRLLDWAQNLHRRGDYFSSLSLAQKALEKNPTSASATAASWIVGRSAHFLGYYDRALENFNNLIQFHNGSEEAAEGFFRSALIYYRKKDFSSAANLLERLLQQGRERYDLSAKYWLIRCLQETNAERAKQNAKELIEKYPFSYYGLRLQAEFQDGKVTWPEAKGDNPKLEYELYLVGAQKKSWQRFKILSDAGWLTEAQMEIAIRPFIKDPGLKLVLAQKMAERHQYAVAIRLINEAMESDVRLRREQFVKIAYPEVYTALYRIEADRYKVPAILLRSLTRQESAFNLQAVSTSNALGLMQMIPPTAQEVSKKLGLKIEIPDDMFRPQVNIPMGSFYVAQMLEQFQGNVPFALAAYNAGPHRLKNWLDGRAEVKDLVARIDGSVQNEVWFDELPWNETSFYVKAILRNILLYRLVEEGSFTLKPALWADSHNKKSE